MKINFTDFKKEFVYLRKILSNLFGRLVKKVVTLWAKLEIFEKNVKIFGRKICFGWETGLRE